MVNPTVDGIPVPFIEDVEMPQNTVALLSPDAIRVRPGLDDGTLRSFYAELVQAQEKGIVIR